MPATAAAQAPVPQAGVSPTPRSYTRSFSSCSPSVSAKPTLQPRGNRSCTERLAPKPATGASAASATAMTACGLPRESTSICQFSPSTAILYDGSCSPATNGTRSGFHSGRPSEQLTESSPANLARTSPPRLFREISPPAGRRSATRAAMHKAPLPHWPASPPSALKTRYPTASMPFPGSSTHSS